MIFAYVPEIQPSWSAAEKVQFLKLKGVANLLSREIFDAANVGKKLIHRNGFIDDLRLATDNSPPANGAKSRGTKLNFDTISRK
jgi:hypothetical protein